MFQKLDFFIIISNLVEECEFFRFKENAQGISRDDYLKFFHFLNNINDVDTALTFYHIANASINQCEYIFLMVNNSIKISLLICTI